MREIKFRVWVEAPDGEEAMYYPKLISFGRSGTLSWATLEDDSVLKDNGWYTKREVMQYTGLKDKNGTEIYEADQIELTYWWFDGNEAESTLTGTVVYIPERACFGIEGVKNEEWLKHIGGSSDSDTLAFADINYSSDDLEVIGNIYENKELLK